MLGSSDVHSPINMAWDFQNGEHRPMTLVFAAERTKKAIKEALFAGRTAVYNGKYLLGKEEYLRPIFEASVQTVSSDDKGGEITIQIHNTCCVTFELRSSDRIESVSFPEQLTLYAGKTVLLKVKIGQRDPSAREILLPYVVQNLLVAPGKGLPVRLKVSLTSQE